MKHIQRICSSARKFKLRSAIFSNNCIIIPFSFFLHQDRIKQGLRSSFRISNTIFEAPVNILLDAFIGVPVRL